MSSSSERGNARSLNKSPEKGLEISATQRKTTTQARPDSDGLDAPPPAFLISFDGGGGFRATPYLLPLDISLKTLLSRGFPVTANLGGPKTKVVGVRSDRCNNLSREHALLFYNDRTKKWLIKDTNSHNGTYVNRHLLTAEKSYLLNSGDRIDLCNPDSDMSAAASYLFVHETPINLYDRKDLALQPGLIDAKTFAKQVAHVVATRNEKSLDTFRDEILRSIRALLAPSGPESKLLPHKRAHNEIVHGGVDDLETTFHRHKLRKVPPMKMPPSFAVEDANFTDDEEGLPRPLEKAQVGHWAFKETQGTEQEEEEKNRTRTTDKEGEMMKKHQKLEARLPKRPEEQDSYEAKSDSGSSEYDTDRRQCASEFKSEPFQKTSMPPPSSEEPSSFTTPAGTRTNPSEAALERTCHFSQEYQVSPRKVVPRLNETPQLTGSETTPAVSARADSDTTRGKDSRLSRTPIKQKHFANKYPISKTAVPVPYHGDSPDETRVGLKGASPIQDNPEDSDVNHDDDDDHIIEGKHKDEEEAQAQSDQAAKVTAAADSVSQMRSIKSVVTGLVSKVVGRSTSPEF